MSMKWQYAYPRRERVGATRLIVVLCNTHRHCIFPPINVDSCTMNQARLYLHNNTRLVSLFPWLWFWNLFYSILGKKYLKIISNLKQLSWFLIVPYQNQPIKKPFNWSFSVLHSVSVSRWCLWLQIWLCLLYFLQIRDFMFTVAIVLQLNDALWDKCVFLIN